MAIMMTATAISQLLTMASAQHEARAVPLIVAQKDENLRPLACCFFAAKDAGFHDEPTSEGNSLVTVGPAKAGGLEPRVLHADCRPQSRSAT